MCWDTFCHQVIHNLVTQTFLKPFWMRVDVFGFFLTFLGRSSPLLAIPWGNSGCGGQGLMPSPIESFRWLQHVNLPKRIQIWLFFISLKPGKNMEWFLPADFPNLGLYDCFSLIHMKENCSFSHLLWERFLAKKNSDICSVNKWNLEVVDQSCIQSQIYLFTLQ